jgi:hypothetical protein
MCPDSLGVAIGGRLVPKPLANIQIIRLTSTVNDYATSLFQKPSMLDNVGALQPAICHLDDSLQSSRQEYYHNLSG